MRSQSNNKSVETGERTAVGTTRRAMLAAGGAVALGALAGCTALDGLIERGAGQVLGTTVSSPAALYPGRPSSDGSASLFSPLAYNQDTNGAMASAQSADQPQLFRTGPGAVRRVPATIQTNGRTFELEGWAINGAIKAQDYNSSRSNKPSTEWWAGPDDDSDGDGYGDLLVAIQDIELDLLGMVVTAQGAVERRDRDEASVTLDAFINATTKALKKGDRIDKCETDVCGTIEESIASAEEMAQTAQNAVNDGDWDTAAAELAAAEELVLRDIERLDDELDDSHPERPRFSDLIAYLRGEPTIGERFTVCLPDAKLPGDRGSLAEELTLYRVLAYFAASNEPDGRRAPFNDQYDTEGVRYGTDGCIQLDGPVSLHKDIACQNIISAELDTYTTANRGIVGYGTKGGAVVSGLIVPVAMDKGLRLMGMATDGTGEIILGEDRDMVMPGDKATSQGSQTLVCPVTVTPADAPCPLPGLFYVRRIIHDDQIIFAGGWTLDEGALYKDSATLLFDEGTTEVASVSKADTESDNLAERIVEQFSRDRSQYGSGVIHDLDSGGDGIPSALQTGEGRKGMNAVNVKIVGAQGGGDADDDGDGILDADEISLSAAGLDGPLLHVAGAKELSEKEKRKAGEEVNILGMGAEKL